MGILDKLIRGVNRAAAPVHDATTLVDPRVRRAEGVAERGATRSGRIIGIERRDATDSTRTVFLIEAAESLTVTSQRFAVEVGTTPHLHRLRLGVEVPVRVDRDMGVIDWPALAARCRLTGPEPAQRLHGTLPPEGIDDSAHRSATLELLERGSRVAATIASSERVAVMGMPTLNWDLRLTLVDGASVERAKEEVPPYAWWYVAPGTQVDVAVDDVDPTRVAVDWAALALAMADGANLDDSPPVGTPAADVEADRGAVFPPAGPASTPADARATIAASRDAGQVNSTLQTWAGEVLAGRMKPKAFLGNVAEWESAGLCTADEAATARASAGLAGR